MTKEINMKNKCCKNPIGEIIPVGKDGYICQKCSEETHKEVLGALEVVNE